MFMQFVSSLLTFNTITALRCSDVLKSLLREVL